MVILCGLLADCEDFEEVEDFGNDRLDFLRTFLTLPNSIPSYNIMDRLMRHLNADQFSQSLSRWGHHLVQQLNYYQLCVDGKELRGTIEPGHKHASVQILSAWVREVDLSLEQVRVSQKSNEIDAVPELLQVLDLRVAIVTTDALNCQKKTAQAILDQGGEYMLCLKTNQGGTLFEQISDHFTRRALALVLFVTVEKGTVGLSNGRSGSMKTCAGWKGRWPGRAYRWWR